MSLLLANTAIIKSQCVKNGLINFTYTINVITTTPFIWKFWVFVSTLKYYLLFYDYGSLVVTFLQSITFYGDLHLSLLHKRFHSILGRKY